jgi:hypothetical protein
MESEGNRRARLEKQDRLQRWGKGKGQARTSSTYFGTEAEAKNGEGLLKFPSNFRPSGSRWFR